MEFRIFRLTFKSGVHIGEGSLGDNSINLRADTIFSALCIEALKAGGEELLNRLVSFAKEGVFLLSDAFPFIKDEYFITKPIMKIQSGQEDTDPAEKKLFKKLKYIPFDMVDDYISGEFDSETAKYITGKVESKLGKASINARAAVDRLEDTFPYHVGVFTFLENAGLYVIAGGNEEALTALRELLGALSFAGIGGKRSSGLGRFTVEEVPMYEDMADRITGEYPAYMTLSCSLPCEEELERSLENASYALIRRSGFVFSDTYADEALRKKDLYVLGSGSVMRNRFNGDVYDVSNNGGHPVYKYAKPLFLGVEI